MCFLEKISNYIHHFFRHTSSIRIWYLIAEWLKKYQLFLGLFLLVIIAFRLYLEKPRVVTLQGESMGTRYCIQYLDKWSRNYQEEIEALLDQIQQALSVFLPSSEVSRFNEWGCEEFYFNSPFFYPVFSKSKEVYHNTSGAFDPTILPLANAWEDNMDNVEKLDSSYIDKLRECVSLDYVVANEHRIKKLKEGVRLDFRGMLKGYAADQLATLLSTHGIKHAWIALENKVVAAGMPNKHRLWHTALHPYLPAIGDLEITIELADRALAISSIKEEESFNFACIIDPVVGYPVRHDLLAAVVLAQDCVTAEAYAMAMMVRGLNYAQELLEKQPELVAFLVYKDSKGATAFYTSSGLRMEQKAHEIKLQLVQSLA